MTTIHNFQLKTRCWILVSLMSLGAWPSASIGQQQEALDSRLFLQIKQAFRNSIERYLSTLEPTQRISLIRAYEQQLDQISNKIDQSEYLFEKMVIARQYMDAHDFHGSQQAYQRIADIDPESKYAARAYLEIGLIGALRTEKSYLAAIDYFKKSVEITEELRKASVDEFADSEVRRIAGSALSQMGDFYFYLGKVDESIETFEYFLSQPDIVNGASESVRRNANSSLGRRLSERGD